MQNKAKKLHKSLIGYDLCGAEILKEVKNQRLVSRGHRDHPNPLCAVQSPILPPRDHKVVVIFKCSCWLLNPLHVISRAVFMMSIRSLLEADPEINAEEFKDTL